jgi:hypothetical protein
VPRRRQPRRDSGVLLVTHLSTMSAGSVVMACSLRAPGDGEGKEQVRSQGSASLCKGPTGKPGLLGSLTYRNVARRCGRVPLADDPKTFAYCPARPAWRTNWGMPTPTLTSTPAPAGPSTSMAKSRARPLRGGRRHARPAAAPLRRLRDDSYRMRTQRACIERLRPRSGRKTERGAAPWRDRRTPGTPRAQLADSGGQLWHVSVSAAPSM